jgi:dGTPase
MKNFNYEHIYESPVLSGYHVYFERILKTLYEYLEEMFLKYGLDVEAYRSENNRLAGRFGDYISKMRGFYEGPDKGFHNLVLDYIAGMTDLFALDCVSEIMIPRRFEYQFDEEAL